MTLSVKSGFAAVEGASLYYEVTGAGPTVVFLHGFSLDLTSWDDPFEAFASRYRVLRYDLRGFGRSLSDEVLYSHASDLKELLDHLDIHDVILVGLSLGGGAAINFALLYPQMVRGLVLVAPSLGGYAWSPSYAEAQASLVARLKDKGIGFVRDLWMRQPLFRHAMRNVEVAAKLRTMIDRYSGWHWIHPNLGQPLSPPAIERLHTIAVPTLVVIGEEDAPDQRNIAELVSKKISRARKTVVPGGGHLVNMEESSLFNQLVLDFLDGI
jgi:3-oxoadipate enol-lactonase